MTDPTVRKWSDVAPPELTLPPLKIEELKGKTITVRKISLASGQYGEFARITIDYAGKTRTLLTGAVVVIERLMAVVDQLPVTCKITYVDPYYIVE